MLQKILWSQRDLISNNNINLWISRRATDRIILNTCNLIGRALHLLKRIPSIIMNKNCKNSRASTWNKSNLPRMRYISKIAKLKCRILSINMINCITISLILRFHTIMSAWKAGTILMLEVRLLILRRSEAFKRHLIHIRNLCLSEKTPNQLWSWKKGLPRDAYLKVKPK